MEEIKFYLKLISKIIIGLSLIFGIFYCVLIIFNYTDLWPQLLAIIASAFLGALITALITRSLLNDTQNIEEKTKKNIKIHESKIQVYSEFISKLWDTLKDDNLTEDELRNIRSNVFQKLIFYLSDEHINELCKLIDNIKPHDNTKSKESVQNNGKLTGKLIETFSSMTILLKKDINESTKNKSKKITEVQKIIEVQKLWKTFKLQPIDKCEDSENETKTQLDISEKTKIMIPTENKIFSYNQAWHFAMWGDEQLNAIGEDKINELSLIEYGEEWRTNLLKQIKENDIVFLFRRGGYGYIGAFRPKGWRIFEKEHNTETIHEFGKDDVVRNITEENKAKYDIYGGIDDGADLCANLIVEPIYYFPNSGTNPGGVYRRTISRYYSEYADKLMEWFKEKSKLTNKV